MSTAIQSKLMMQLNRQQLISVHQKPDEKRLEEVYAIACKAQPNNLKLVEFINLVLEKGLMTNSHGLRTYTNIFQEFSNKSIQSDSMNITKNTTLNPDEEKKFHKQKFIRVFTELAKRLYPGDDTAFQNIFYNRLLGIDGEDGRMRIDQNIKKFITKDTIKYLLDFEEDMHRLFIMYIPENYNKSLDFSWDQAKMLDRRLPIVCLLRFLWECQVCPTIVSVTGLFELVAKYLPPSSNNHREVIFYSVETASSYTKQSMTSNTIKLLEGDIGLSFHEFQLIMLRLCFEVSKQNQQKPDFILMIRKLFSEIVGLRASPQATFPDIKKKTKFHQKIMAFAQTQIQRKSKKPRKKSVSKVESSIDLEDNDENNDGKDDENLKNKLKNVKLMYDIETIRRSIDQDTPCLPEIVKCNKENEGVYDINEKFVVIGQQLPKIPQKVKAPAPKSKKQPDELLGYKPQTSKSKIESYSHFKQMMNNPYKTRRASQYYPVLLSQIASPQGLQPDSQLYVQTAFISLAEHNYQNALSNLKQARQIQKVSKIQNQLFFYFIQGQIYEAMGRDDIALDSYYKCKEIVHSFKNNDVSSALPYCGLGSCLYHAEEYEYSLRCFLKAKEIREKILDQNSVEMANLFNNIGCCFLKLERANEARKYFELSHSILDLQLGVYHQKTLTVYQNLSKSKKSFVQRIPAYKVLWRTYELKDGVTLPKKKTK